MTVKWRKRITCYLISCCQNVPCMGLEPVKKWPNLRGSKYIRKKVDLLIEVISDILCMESKVWVARRRLSPWLLVQKWLLQLKQRPWRFYKTHNVVHVQCIQSHFFVFIILQLWYSWIHHCEEAIRIFSWSHLFCKGEIHQQVFRLEQKWSYHKVHTFYDRDVELFVEKRKCPGKLVLGIVLHWDRSFHIHNLCKGQQVLLLDQKWSHCKMYMFYGREVELPFDPHYCLGNISCGPVPLCYRSLGRLPIQNLCIWKLLQGKIRMCSRKANWEQLAMCSF